MRGMRTESLMAGMPERRKRKEGTEGRKLTKLELRAREDEALQMRLAGESQTAIAAELGYQNNDAVYAALERAYSRTHIEPLKDQMYLAMARYEALLLAVMPRATDPSARGHLAAVREARQIQASITKLFGLNAPERVDVRVWNEIESSTREMASGLGYDDIALGEAVEFMKEHYPQLASGKP